MTAKRRGRARFKEEQETQVSAPPGKSCGGCYYFGMAYDTTVCKFNPPVVVASNNKVSTRWPWTPSTEWCGKYLEATSVP